MSAIARYVKVTADPGKGDALADAFLRVAEGSRQAQGCELYVINRVPDAPDELWVTEIWASAAASDAALAAARADEQGAALMAEVQELAAAWAVSDLEPVGGVGLAPAPLPGWERVRIDEQEDLGVGYGLQGVQEMRQLTAPLGLERTGLTVQRILPGQRQAFGHSHVNAEETYVVLAGSGTLKLTDTEVTLSARDAVRVGPEQTRAFAAGPDGLEYLAVGPRQKGDGEMHTGWWG